MAYGGGGVAGGSGGAGYNGPYIILRCRPYRCNNAEIL